MTVQIYELADVAAILGIAKSRVKNWTIGRPFALRPSVRTSLGKGSRNLFSRNDLHCFALVQRLNDARVPVAAIRFVLKDTELYEERFWKNYRWIVIQCWGRDGVALTALKSNPNVDMAGSEHPIVCSYKVNLRSIVNSVSERIEMKTTPRRKNEPTVYQPTLFDRPRLEKGAKQKRLTRTRASKAK